MSNPIENFFRNNKPKFIFGAQDYKQIPDYKYPEIAFLGRSNVGKSSLINAITKSEIAITSKTPGRTRQLNFFTVGEKINIVDMPGYGFAAVSKKAVIEWQKLIFDYLNDRKNLKMLFILIDGRHGIKNTDEEVLRTLNANGILYQIILTKIDDCKKNQIEDLMHSIQSLSTKNPSMYPEVLFASARKGYNVFSIQERIFDFIEKK